MQYGIDASVDAIRNEDVVKGSTLGKFAEAMQRSHNSIGKVYGAWFLKGCQAMGEKMQAPVHALLDLVVPASDTVCSIDGQKSQQSYSCARKDVQKGDQNCAQEIQQRAESCVQRGIGSVDINGEQSNMRCKMKYCLTKFGRGRIRHWTGPQCVATEYKKFTTPKSGVDANKFCSQDVTVDTIEAAKTTKREELEEKGIYPQWCVDDVPPSPYLLVARRACVCPVCAQCLGV